MPSRRPDIFPEFDKPERVFLPKPLPGDPAMPDEELEESVKRTTPGDPDPEHKTGEPVSERAGERTNESSTIARLDPSLLRTCRSPRSTANHCIERTPPSPRPQPEEPEKPPEPGAPEPERKSDIPVIPE